MEKTLGNKKAIVLFMAPAVILVFGMLYIPICSTFIYSLFNGSPGFKMEFVNINNYIDLFKDQIFVQSFYITLIYTIIQVIGQVMIGLALAFMLELIVKKYKDAVKTIIFFPAVIPAIAVAQLFIKIYEIQPQYGLLSSLLKLLGLDFLIRGWLGDTSTALGALCVADIWRFMGFYTVLFYAAIIEISRDVLEAARIDGVTNFTMIRHILLPLLRPIIITALSYCFIGTIKVFEMPFVMTNGGPGYSTNLTALYIYNTAFTHSKYGYGCAISIFLLIETLLITLLFRKVTKIKNNDF